MNEWVKLHSEDVTISVSSTPWGGNGLIGKDFIRQGDVVLEMHEDAVINSNTAFNHEIFGDVFKSYAEYGMPSHLLVILTLVYFLNSYNHV
jgi:hypothetical protein